MANTLKRQAREYIESTFWGYVNGIVDDNYEVLTEDGWIEYITKNRDMDIAHNQRVNGNEFRHLLFFGNENFTEEIKRFLRTKDAQEYIRR